MLRIFFSTPNQGVCLVRVCPGYHLTIGTNRLKSIKEFAKVVSALGDRVAKENRKPPYPTRYVISFPIRSRKELLMYLKEKAAVAAAAYVPNSGLNRVHNHPTTEHSGWQGFQNIFSNKRSNFTIQITVNSILNF